MKANRRKTLWIAAILALAGLAAWKVRPQPTEADLAEVVTGPLAVTVDEDGETRIREPYLISAPLTGRLLRVELEPGDTIRRGDTLAVIDPGEPGLLDARSKAEAEARVSAAEAAHQRAASQLEIAAADLEKAERYHKRDLGRFEQGDISQPNLEDTEYALRVARGNVAAAQSGVEIAKFDLAQARAALIHSQNLTESTEVAGRQFRIESPIDGVVLRRFQESSTLVPAAERILEIGDPTDLELRVDVLSQDAVKIRPGQRVLVEHWGGEESLLAYVRRVEPSAFTKVSSLGVDEQRVWIYADFAAESAPTQQGMVGDPTGLNEGKSDNPGPSSNIHPALGDAYRIEARIVVWESDAVAKVPAGALFRQGEKWALYTVENGVARSHQVEIGQHNGIEAEVLAGARPGDRVILHPGDHIRDGSRVTARRDG